MAILVNRTYTLRTTRLLAEYLASTYPNDKRISEFRLGALDPGILANLSHGIKPGIASQTRGYVDAIVVTPSEVMLWEAKNKVSYSGIGQLEGYYREWANTPEAKAYEGFVVTMHLLAAYDDTQIAESAREKGIEIVIYRPQWYISDLLNSMDDSNARRHAAAIAEAGRSQS